MTIDYSYWFKICLMYLNWYKINIYEQVINILSFENNTETKTVFHSYCEVPTSNF